MPKNITDRYKNDEQFRERMKENSRKRYAELKEGLELLKKQKLTHLPTTLPVSSSVIPSIPSSSQQLK
jgi:hypothetical protein